MEDFIFRLCPGVELLNIPDVKAGVIERLGEVVPVILYELGQVARAPCVKRYGWCVHVFVLLEQLAQRRGREKSIPLNRQVKASAHRLQFREPEIPKLWQSAHGKAEKHILASDSRIALKYFNFNGLYFWLS